MKLVLASGIFLLIMATKTYSQQAEVIYKTYCGGFTSFRHSNTGLHTKGRKA
jgi:hypothetical protein